MSRDDDQDMLFNWILDKGGVLPGEWRRDELLAALRAAELEPESRRIIEVRAELRNALDALMDPA